MKSLRIQIVCLQILYLTTFVLGRPGRFTSGPQTRQHDYYMVIRNGIVHPHHPQLGHADIHRTAEETQILELQEQAEKFDKYLKMMDSDPELVPPDPDDYPMLHLLRKKIEKTAGLSNIAQTKATDKHILAQVWSGLAFAKGRSGQGKKSVKGKAEGRNRDEGRARKKRIVEKANSRRWTKGIVPYDMSQVTDPDTVRGIQVAMDKIEKYTCIRFVPWVANETRSQYGLDHDGHLNFVAAAGCWAIQGNVRSPGGQGISCCGWAACVHELGHTLGAAHEHISYDRDDYVRVNWDNILPGYQRWYYKASRDDYVSTTFDLSNIMSYGETVFGIPGRRTMDTFEKYVVFSRSDYYFFEEIVTFHDCKGLACGQFSMECKNDGFVTLVDGKCSCFCPPGLDPSTGCTTVEKTVANLPTKWPVGGYGLLSSRDGCPGDSGEFQEGTVEEVSKGWNYVFEIFNLGGITPYKNTYHFCMMNSRVTPTGSHAKWGPGKYCIYRYGGSCPAGFKTSYAQFDDPTTATEQNSKMGSVPDGVYGNNTRFEFCCRNDGFESIPLELPNTKPFILYRNDFYQKCQSVKGMLAIPEWYTFGSDDVDNVNPGFHGEIPVLGISWGSQFYYIYYCYYVPQYTDCGAVYELNKGLREITFSSPNYPQNYPNAAKCTWFITGPEYSALRLKFLDLDIHYSSDCQDALYIRFDNPGEAPTPFCGGTGKVFGTFHSVKNTLMMTFESDLITTRKGFKATVKVDLAEDTCFSHEDKGRSYRGHKNYSRSFKPCVSWKDVFHCRHSLYGSSDDSYGLEGNYCRNPGSGLRPWCYVTIETCQREYCDACNLDNPSDTIDDCNELKANGKCENNLQLARSGCSFTCASSLPTESTPPKTGDIQCSAPPAIQDAYLLETVKAQYKLGEKVTYRCNYGDEEVKSTCLSTSQWSNVGYVCGGCSTGWHYLNGYCYKYMPEEKNTYDARTACGGYNNGILSPAITEEELDLIDRIRPEQKSALIGLSDEEEENKFVWSDGTPANGLHWAEGEPNNWYNEDCVVLGGKKLFWDVYCYWDKYPFICRTRPSARQLCVDRFSDCATLFDQDPLMCFDQPSFAHVQCSYTCGICDQISTPSCSVPNAGSNSNAQLVTWDSSIRRGEVALYECDLDFVLTSGNLERGCRADGSLTGVQPICTDVNQAVTELNAVELFERQSVGENGHVYAGWSPNLLFQRQGVVSQWRFDSREARDLALQVWRPHPEQSGNNFQFVGQNRLTSKPYRINVVDIGESDRIAVRAGDFVGIWYGEGEGGLTFDVCETTETPSGQPINMMPLDQTTLRSNGSYQFDDVTDCFIFSLQATIAPAS